MKNTEKLYYAVKSGLVNLETMTASQVREILERISLTPNNCRCIISNSLNKNLLNN